MFNIKQNIVPVFPMCFLTHSVRLLFSRIKYTISCNHLFFSSGNFQRHARYLRKLSRSVSTCKSFWNILSVDVLRWRALNRTNSNWTRTKLHLSIGWTEQMLINFDLSNLINFSIVYTNKSDEIQLDKYECFFHSLRLNRNFWNFFFQNIKRYARCLFGNFMLNEFAWEICTWHVNYIELRPCTHFEHVLFIHFFYQWKKKKQQTISLREYIYFRVFNVVLKIIIFMTSDSIRWDCGFFLSSFSAIHEDNKKRHHVIMCRKEKCLNKWDASRKKCFIVVVVVVFNIFSKRQRR